MAQPLEFTQIRGWFCTTNPLSAPVERPAIAAYADDVGRLPGIGTVIGLVRMISALAVMLFSTIASLMCSNQEEDKKLHENTLSRFEKAEIELDRGFMELLPGLALILDLVSYLRERNYKYIHSRETGSNVCVQDERLNANFGKIQGSLPDSPCGKYVHIIITGEGQRIKFYGWQQHTGSTMIVQGRPPGSIGMLVPQENISV